jgi:Tfp pilus assembly protein PilF
MTEHRQSGPALLLALFAATTSLPPARADESERPEPIRQMIGQAHSALAHGDAAGAANLFEKAASHCEYPDAEVGEVRARLWAGQFRHAVAISNVVAGEHPESAEAQALLAFVEDRNGYTAQALERLRRERKNHAGNVSLVLAEAEILIDRHDAREAIKLIDARTAEEGPQADLCRLRVRAQSIIGNDATDSPCDGSTPPNVKGSGWFEFTLDPFPAALGAPTGAGNGLIIDNGRKVATLKTLVDIPSAAIWVRNMRGELRKAVRAKAAIDRSSELAILTLEKPFPAEHSLPRDQPAPRDVHGLCFTLSFPAPASSDPLLPLETPCFALNLQGATGPLQLNIPLSPGERGSPVFDAQGRLLGLSVPSWPAASAGSRPTVSRLPGPTALQVDAASQPAMPAATIAMPELYERLAPAVAQVAVFKASSQ